MMMMTLFASCVILCVLCVSDGSTLRCRWMDQKFKQYSEEMVKLLDNMVKNSTNTTEVDLPFPHHMYQLASKAPAEEKLAFSVQVLHEVFALLEEDHTNAHWDEKKVNDFLNVLSRQAEELNACIKSKSHVKKHKKLQMYFHRLSRNVLQLKNHSSEAWEITRKEVKVHLLNVDLVASALVPII